MTDLQSHWGTIEERVWSRVVAPIDPNACWTWTGAKDVSGHGRTTLNGKAVKVYRLVYEWMVGPIPEGLVIDHLCRNPTCVNPRHLEPVTLVENFRRSPIVPFVVNAAKTECIHGHAFSVENTLHYQGRSGPARKCRACHRARSAAYSARKKAAQ